MLLVGSVCLFIGSLIGMSIMAVCAVNAYNKGYQDALKDSME